MSEIKLLPCPFCGGEAELVRQHSGVSDKIYIVSCKNEECEASLGHFCELKEMAITEWNTRKPMQDIVERLEEELKIAEEEKNRCASENPLQFECASSYANGIDVALDFVKEVGGMNE